MKLNKTIISILIMLIIISIELKSFAKYVFEYTEKAIEITIKN